MILCYVPQEGTYNPSTGDVPLRYPPAPCGMARDCAWPQCHGGFAPEPLLACYEVLACPMNKNG